MIRNLRVLLTLAAGLLMACMGVQAQTFPVKPVHLVVPAGAGSFPDQVGRRLADKLSALWGQQVVVENRPGGGGIAAMTEFLKAAPDGHTLALGTMSQLVFNKYLFRTLPYDPLSDVAPIGTVLSGSLMVVAHPSLPAQTLSQLVVLAQRQPGRLDFAIPANASPPHVVLGMLMEATHSSFSVVPFKTGAEAVVQVTAGQVPLFIDAVPVVAPLVESGRLRALAVTGSQRVPQFPAVPTVQEQGYPAFHGEAWMGLVARSGTPPELVARINRDLAQALTADDLRQFFETSGARVLVDTPQEFADLLRTEQVRWGAVIKATRIAVE